VVFWIAFCVPGWLLCHVRSLGAGRAPEPFNWRIFLGPGVYYTWLENRDG